MIPNPTVRITLASNSTVFIKPVSLILLADVLSLSSGDGELFKVGAFGVFDDFCAFGAFGVLVGLWVDEIRFLVGLRVDIGPLVGL